LDAAIYACLTTTFWATARIGETTVPTLTSFDHNVHVKPSNVSKETDRQGLSQTAFFIPCTKSAPQGESIAWAKQDGDADLEAALENHFNVNIPPQEGHLFTYKWKNSHHPLTRTAFLKRIKLAADTADLEKLQGHGICIGSTLEYLLRGIPFDIVKVKGHWPGASELRHLHRISSSARANSSAIHASHSYGTGRIHTLHNSPGALKIQVSTVLTTRVWVSSLARCVAASAKRHLSL
jgi:hypothetical protein